MPYKPVFLVNVFKIVMTARLANRYSVTAQKERKWKVGMLHGYFAGLGLDFYFPSDAEASRFSLWTIYTPEDIINAMDNAKYTVSSVEKTQKMGVANRYTGTRYLQDAWLVTYEGEQRGHFLQEWFMSEAMANARKVGAAVSLVDILGTLPVVPRDMAAFLQAQATRAAEAELEAQRRDEELARIRQEQEAAELAAAIAAAIAAAEAANAAAQAAAQEAAAAAAQAAATTQAASTLQTAQNNAVAQWWQITAGGARGYYAADNILLETGATWVASTQKGPYVLYPAGTFTRGVMPLTWGGETTRLVQNLYTYEWWGYFVPA